MKYPKLAEKEHCEFPEREDCNYGEGYARCPNMKYDNSQNIFSPTRWFCKYKREKIIHKCESLNKSLRRKKQDNFA